MTGQSTTPPIPPAELQPESFANRLYNALAPVAQEDPIVGWSLLTYVNALGVMFQIVDELVRDSPEGPGWSAVMDVDRCPPEMLGWLAQFVGVRIPLRLTEVEQRAWVRSTDGFKRGTRDAMIGACAATLTGAKAVLFRERDGANMGYPLAPEYAYCVGVRTFASQTPDSALTLRALLAQKPGGILLDYKVMPGQSYDTLKATNASYNAVKAKYKDYNAVRTDEVF